MKPIRSLFLLLIFSLGALASPAANYRTNVDQSGPPPGCFESPTHRYTITNPANSGQIWEIVLRTHHWVDGSGGSNGYYTSPAPTGEVVELMPGDSAFFWHARGYQTAGGRQIVGINWSESHITNVSVMAAPTITWTSEPGTVAHGQGYTISAHGHDGDGNLTQVNIWKDGQPFAFAGGGNGTDGDSSNPSNDSGPRTITFTAQSVDANGAMSQMISQVVTVSAPINQPPTVTLLSPGAQTVTAGTSLSIRARATDPDGNVSGHNLDIQRPAGDWNFQGGFATGEPYQGGPIGSGADSTRSANFTFTDVGTYQVRSGAYDGSGWYHSSTISITVVPANRAPSISWTSTPGTVANGQNYSISAHGHDDDGNLAHVNIWKDGQPFAFAGGGNGTDGNSSNSTSDPGPRTVTFSAQSVDTSGASSATITQTVTITAPPPVEYALTTAAESGGSVSAGGSFPAGSVATVTATPDATHVFSGWTGDANGTANPLNVTMDRDRTLRAHFTPRSYSVTTQVTPVGAGSTTGGGTYGHGETTTLTPTANSGWRFDHWSGDVTGSANPQSLLVDEAKSVTAHFARLTYLLTVSTQGNGTTTGAGSYTHGDTATVSASPAAGWRFDRFTGDFSGTTPAGSVLMNGDRSLTAHFVRNTFTLVTQADSGGTVSAGGTYPEGTTVGVTATPDAQHDFVGWVGDAVGSSPSVSVLINGPKTVRARFAQKQFPLTTSATHGGTVTPGGSYPIGTVVTISANAASDARFVSWNGDASGTNPSVAITMDGPKSVLARFITKIAQTISFPSPTDTSEEIAEATVNASATSGLSVSFTVLSGPATLHGNRLILNGPGAVTVQATQGGNDEYLPAPPVTRSFNVVAPAIVKYVGASRTLLQASSDGGLAPIILERP